MPAAANRRPLKFASLEEIAVEAERLHQDGYAAQGAWNLSQVCHHVADWMSFPMDGFPRANPAIRLVLWAMKVTMGRRQLQKILTSGSMPAGSPTLPQTIGRADEDEAAAVGQLRETVERLKQYQGAIHPSPLFGSMDYESCEALQRIHAAHHFSFLHPQANSNQANADEQR